MNESIELIRVAQLPVIEEQLHALKDEIDRRVQEALSMACTEETVKDVKKKRAELNKLRGELEERRRGVETTVMAPIVAFREVYKECAAGSLEDADRQLKEKIDAVERELKARCEAELRAYFEEMCAAEHVEWLEFDRYRLRLTMADARSKNKTRLKDWICAYVQEKARDVRLLEGMEHPDELLVEYKKCLSVNGAIGEVRERHRRMEAERQEAERRREIQAREAGAVARVEAAAPPAIVPKTETAEKILTAKFTAHGTKAQLIRLREYMKTEGIRYE